MGLFSVLEMVAYSNDIGASNKLLSISNMCNLSSMIAFADMQVDTERLLSKSSAGVIEILQNSFYRSQATRLITSVMWPEDETFIAFSHPGCLINADECSRKIK